MESQIYNERLYDFSGTGVGTNAGVSVTQAAVTGERYIVTHIACSGDAAAIVTIESPSSTILWRKRFSAAFNVSEHFTHPTIKGASGGAVLVKISASSSNCEANIGGYAVKG